MRMAEAPKAKEDLVRDVSRIALRYCRIDNDFSDRTYTETKARLFRESEQDLSSLRECMLSNMRINRLFFLKMYLEAEGDFGRRAEYAHMKIASVPIIGSVASLKEIENWESFQKEKFATCDRTEPRFINSILAREVWKTTAQFDGRLVEILVKGKEFSGALGVRTGCVVAYNLEDMACCPVRKTAGGAEIYYYDTKEKQVQLYSRSRNLKAILWLVEQLKSADIGIVQKALDFAFGIVMKKNSNSGIQRVLNGAM